MLRCKFMVTAEPFCGLIAELVMPTAEAALARLRADDPVWQDAKLLSAVETDEMQSPPGELGIIEVA